MQGHPFLVPLLLLSDYLCVKLLAGHWTVHQVQEIGALESDLPGHSTEEVVADVFAPRAMA